MKIIKKILRRIKRKNTNSIKAIIFDYDGVIMDSFGSVFNAYKKICESLKITCPNSIDDFRKIYGYSFIDLHKNLGIKNNDTDYVHDIFKNEMVASEHKIFPGILDVLDELKDKYSLFLVTSSHSDEVLKKIKIFALESFFKQIYCGADKKIRKADLIKGLLKENNYSTKNVISIGDRLIDYDVAKKVGIRDENIILVRYGWGLDESKINKAKVANNPKEILNFIA